VIGSSRAEKKVSAALRAKQMLEAAWARIDYAEDVIKPAVLQVRALEEKAEVEVTESDLISLLTTGTMPIESGESQ
jgi:hypothetical protein